MRLTTVFNKLLSLQGAWVTGVRFARDHVVVIVAPRRRRHRCPQCGYSTSGGYDRRRCRWRHVALGRWAVIVEALLRRLACPRHGVLTEAVPWAVPGSKFTLDFEDLVAWLAREMTITAVTRLVHVAWVTVGRIVARVVARKLDRGRLEALYTIGLDEVSYRKGQKYLSIVANHATGTPVWIGEGRSRETVSRFFAELGSERAQRLCLVTMDMSGAYIEEVRAQAPQAEASGAEPERPVVPRQNSIISELLIFLERYKWLLRPCFACFSCCSAASDQPFDRTRTSREAHSNYVKW